MIKQKGSTQAWKFSEGAPAPPQRKRRGVNRRGKSCGRGEAEKKGKASHDTEKIDLLKGKRGKRSRTNSRPPAPISPPREKGIKRKETAHPPGSGVKKKFGGVKSKCHGKGTVKC